MAYLLASSLSVILMLTMLFGGCSIYREQPRNNDDANNARAVNPENASLSLFGNISAAGEDPNNYLIIGDGSAFSYNNSRGTMNWVAWKTARADLGESVERPDFRPDPRLPIRFVRVTSSDYSGSGYDRGHMVPAADRFANLELLQETFLMTNIVPQSPSLNQYPWEKLESYARSQARRGWDIYQIAGVYGEQGILKNEVVVPTNCWKIIVMLRSGSDISYLNGRTRVIAVDMPNRDGMQNEKWQRYVTNIRSIEAKTGYNFFASLPADQQETLETRRELSFPR